MSLLPEERIAELASTVSTNFRHQQAAADAIRQAIRETAEECAKQIPSNWCDPLLSGPNAVLSTGPWSCQDIERLLNAIRRRSGA